LISLQLNPKQNNSMKKSIVPNNFTQRLLELISEPSFIKFLNIQNEPNIFKIVGRTHYERWHSCFWGWLLDSNGSHLLRDYTLIRLLFLLLDKRCLKSSLHNSIGLIELLPSVEFSEIGTIPNEYISTETNIKGLGRFDIFVTANYKKRDEQKGKINLLFELKIDSKISSDQSKKYADWLLDNHPNDINVLIYILPNLIKSSKTTIGDERWYCIDYQLLNDKLLMPILDHPNINEKVKPFIIQYIKNLKFRYRGIKMAITNEEKKIAQELYEKYSDVFDSIYDALQSSGTIDFSTSETDSNKGRASGKIAIKIDGKIIEAETVRNLFKLILKYIVDNKVISKIPLPWGNSSKRYILSNENPPIHPSGREFFYPEKYKGYTIETHYARERAISVVAALCDKFEIEFETVEI
jgi:hypothetical protein